MCRVSKEAALIISACTFVSPVWQPSSWRSRGSLGFNLGIGQPRAILSRPGSFLTQAPIAFTSCLLAPGVEGITKAKINPCQTTHRPDFP